MTGSTGRTLQQMEDRRRDLIRESEHIKLALGGSKARRARRYRRGDPRATPPVDREALKGRLVRINELLRETNDGIKSERRRLTSLLDEGSPRPRNAFQYVVALYRLFDDAVPADQRSRSENAMMRRARDFVMMGMVDHGGGLRPDGVVG